MTEFTPPPFPPPLGPPPKPFHHSGEGEHERFVETIRHVDERELAGLLRRYRRKAERYGYATYVAKRDALVAETARRAALTGTEAGR